MLTQEKQNQMGLGTDKGQANQEKNKSATLQVSLYKAHYTKQAAVERIQLSHRAGGAKTKVQAGLLTICLQIICIPAHQQILRCLKHKLSWIQMLQFHATAYTTACLTEQSSQLAMPSQNQEL